MIPTKVHPPAFLALVGQLGEGLGVELPDKVLTAHQVCTDASTGVLTQQAAASEPRDLLGLTRDELTAYIRDHAVSALLHRLNESTSEVATSIREAAAQVLREHADEILDQLRPKFETAAKPVHAATKLGIRPGTTPAHVLDLGTKAITAWQALSGHVAVLDEIASARIAMADVLTIEPMPNPFGERQYGAAFSPLAPRWSAPGDRTSLDRWLRLSTDRPLTLLALTETDAADRDARVIAAPIAEGNLHATRTPAPSGMFAR